MEPSKSLLIHFSLPKASDVFCTLMVEIKLDGFLDKYIVYMCCVQQEIVGPCETLHLVFFINRAKGEQLLFEPCEVLTPLSMSIFHVGCWIEHGHILAAFKELWWKLRNTCRFWGLRRL